MNKVQRLTEYANHCAMMAKMYARTHPRWVWYSTMAHAKALQAKFWATH